jgi:putative phosphoserine phosphatase/1-acylglycerol-3-phosphate O-acyltransferase
LAKEIAALFDFDGTLYTGHIWQDVARHHWATRRHRRWVVIYVARNMVPLPLYKLGLISQMAYYRLWGETMGWLLRGWTEQEGLDFFEQMTREPILPNLRPEMVERIRHHQAQGHLVALVSGTFSPWLEAVARQLDVPHAIGTPLELKNGRLTGRIVPPLCQGQGKLVRIRSYLAERGLDIDWRASYAYGDSGPDAVLLGAVGHPVAAYPDRALLARARAQDWPVMGEVTE